MLHGGANPGRAQTSRSGPHYGGQLVPSTWPIVLLLATLFIGLWPLPWELRERLAFFTPTRSC